MALKLLESSMISVLNNKLTTYIVLALIIAIGVFLRFYQLGVNPPSLTWDEVSMGYNAYSILKTGADEYGNKFPISIRSFDDYKPALYTYLIVPFINIFGLNEFAVRIPSALIGVLSILAIYFLVKELLQKWDKEYQGPIALASAFFLAISPMSLQFSRAAFEGNIGLFFFISGLLFFLKAFRNGNFFYPSTILFLLSLYSYHSFRLFIPLFVLAFLATFWRGVLNFKKQAIISILILFFFSFPIWNSFLAPIAGTGARLSMVTIFSDPTLINPSIERIDYDRNNNDLLGSLLHNRRIVYSLAIAKGYLDHFNLDFLFIHGDGGVQHHAVDMGMIYLWELPFILAGLYILVNRRNRYALILILLFLLAPLPSAITTGTPHPVRAIAMMPAFHIFTAIGVVSFYFWIKKMNGIFRFCIFIFTFSFFILNFIYYLHQYYVHSPIEYGYFWQYGYKEALNFAKENEANFNNIIMTYEYDQPYVYYLFYNKIDPVWYQKNWDYNKNGAIDRFKRVIGKYTFRNIEYSKDINIPNTLLIGSPKEIPDNAKVIKTIKFPDGKVAFKIVKT